MGMFQLYHLIQIERNNEKRLLNIKFCLPSYLILRNSRNVDIFFLCFWIFIYIYIYFRLCYLFVWLGKMYNFDVLLLDPEWYKTTSEKVTCPVLFITSYFWKLKQTTKGFPPFCFLPVHVHFDKKVDKRAISGDSIYLMAPNCHYINVNSYR